MFVATQVLGYADHDEEIHTINTAVSLLRDVPDTKAAVDFLLARLNTLQTANAARLALYDQRVLP